MSRTVIHAVVNGLVLQVGSIVGVVAGFLAYRRLLPANQLLVQVPVFALVLAIAYRRGNRQGPTSPLCPEASAGQGGRSCG